MRMRGIGNIDGISSPELSDLHSMHTNFVHSSIGIVNDALESGHGIGDLVGHVRTLLDEIEVRLREIEVIGHEMAARLTGP